METMWEPEWHEILVKNLNNALELCQQAGISVHDDTDFDYEVDCIRFSPAQGKVIIKFKHVDKKE